MEANACVETISQKFGDGHRRRQEQRPKTEDEYNDQVETFDSKGGAAVRSEKTAEGLFGATKVFPTMRNTLQQVLQEVKGAREQCTPDVACFQTHEEQHVATEIKEIKRGIGPMAQKAHEGC